MVFLGLSFFNFRETGQYFWYGRSSLYQTYENLPKNRPKLSGGLFGPPNRKLSTRKLGRRTKLGANWKTVMSEPSPFLYVVETPNQNQSYVMFDGLLDSLK